MPLGMSRTHGGMSETHGSWHGNCKAIIVPGPMRTTHDPISCTHVARVQSGMVIATRARVHLFIAGVRVPEVEFESKSA